MSKFFLLLVAGLFTQAGAVDPSQNAPLCTPEHRAWFLRHVCPFTRPWYDHECANIRRVREQIDNWRRVCELSNPQRRDICSVHDSRIGSLEERMRSDINRACVLP